MNERKKELEKGERRENDGIRRGNRLPMLRAKSELHVEKLQKNKMKIKINKKNGITCRKISFLKKNIASVSESQERKRGRGSSDS